MPASHGAGGAKERTQRQFVRISSCVTPLNGEFGWGGTLVKQQRRCPEERLSVNRNHA